MRATWKARLAAPTVFEDRALHAARGPGDDDELTAHLRVVVLAALAEERSGFGPDANTAAGLRAVCEHARRRGMPVTRVLVSLKDAWRAEHPPPRPGQAHDSDTRLARVVSRCIEVYYRDAD